MVWLARGKPGKFVSPPHKADAILRGHWSSQLTWWKLALVIACFKVYRMAVPIRKGWYSSEQRITLWAAVTNIFRSIFFTERKIMICTKNKKKKSSLFSSSDQTSTLQLVTVWNKNMKTWKEDHKVETVDKKPQPQSKATTVLSWNRKQACRQLVPPPNLSYDLHNSDFTAAEGCLFVGWLLNVPATG